MRPSTILASLNLTPLLAGFLHQSHSSNPSCLVIFSAKSLGNPRAVRADQLSRSTKMAALDFNAICPPAQVNIRNAANRIQRRGSNL